MTSICLGMIVRDAEAHVERCIRSALPYVSRWTIIDTGSTDRTREIVQETLKDLPGQLLESEWLNHAHNRSELLAAAKTGCDYILMLDADMEVVVDGSLPELDSDSYLITIKDRGMEYPLPLLTSTKKPFYYAGVAHCYLASHEEQADSGWLREMVLIDHGGGGHREGKIERDRDLLAAEVGKNALDRRSWFYLAQSYRDLDQIDEAITAYSIRAALGGWDEEVYYALYQAGTLLCEHRDARKGMKLLLDAYLMKPNRNESLRALGHVALNVADKVPLPKDDVLFVYPSGYHQPLEPGVGLRADQVSAVLVTRGNVDMQPILDVLPFEDVVVWNNSKEEDNQIYGRYKALERCKNDVIFTVDDDVIFTRFDDLLALYEPGMIVANMDESWAGIYGRETALIGAGALWDRNLPGPIFDQYLTLHPFDEDFRLCCDFIFGSKAPFKLVDLGYGVREFSDDEDRLYRQPGQTERKFEFIKRAKALA